MKAKHDFLASLKSTETIEELLCNFSTKTDPEFVDVVDVFTSDEHEYVWRKMTDYSMELISAALSEDEEESEILSAVQSLKRILNLLSFYFERTKYRPPELFLALQNL